METESENELDKALAQAAQDRVYVPHFYKTFLNSVVIAIESRPEGVESQSGSGDTNEGICLKRGIFEGQPYVPIFSSVLQIKKYIRSDGEIAIVTMPAPELLLRTQGNTLILNPASGRSKLFTPKEAKSLLDGTIWKPDETLVAQKSMLMLLAQPKDFPNELVSLLCRYFQTTPDVQRAYLALAIMPEREENPFTLIGIETSGDWEKIAGGAGMVSVHSPIPNPPLEFIRIIDDGNRSPVFGIEDKPFYEKSKNSS